MHRLPHDKRGSVYAYAEELDAWWKARGQEQDNDFSPKARTPAPRARVNWAVAAGVVLVVAVFVIYRLFRPDNKSNPVASSVLRITTEQSLVTDPAIVLIRRLANRAIRREAERRCDANHYRSGTLTHQLD